MDAWWMKDKEVEGKRMKERRDFFFLGRKREKGRNWFNKQLL